MIDATVAIVTRNRCAELRSALASATSQHGAVEVLVVDDSSDDRETEDVAREFPEVRFVRFEERAGLVVRRDYAARLASGPVIVSIDDDAVFSSDDCLLQTLRLRSSGHRSRRDPLRRHRGRVDGLPPACS